MVYKQPKEKYTKMELAFTAKGQLLAIEGRFFEADIQSVELGQESYFDLHKGDILKYHLLPL